MSEEDTQMILPTERNDEDSLENRMTENAYTKILPERYLRKDENGDVIESPEFLFKRVAKNIAVAEAVYTDERVMIEHKHIKPTHSRRNELIDEIFRTDQHGNQEQRVYLNEKNARYVSYDRLIKDAPAHTSSKMYQWAEKFHDMMSHLNFMPNTPTLINAGDELQQLSACFVNSPDDDMHSIHETAREAAMTFQTGGGMGYDFSQLRPYGDVVGSTGGIASGPITFMETFDQVCQTIAQGGVRRGAQMGVMRVDHPDIIHFIHAKNKDVSLAHTLGLASEKDFRNSSFEEALEEARGLIKDGKVPTHLRNAAEGFLSNFNISVAVTDEFMESLKDNKRYEVMNPRTGEQHIATEETVEMYDWFGLGDHIAVGEHVSLPTKEIWDRIVEGAYENGEPGVIFIDRINQEHSFDTGEYPEHKIRATNPCSEQPLEEYEACNLGHINVSTLADADAPGWSEFRDQYSDVPKEDLIHDFMRVCLRMDELDRRIETGVRFLDNVVTMSDFPIEKIDSKVREMRKIGLGIMGLSQLFIQTKVKYGSETGNLLSEALMKYINWKSKMVSHDLAQERGSFSEWEQSKYADPKAYSDWFEKHVGEDSSEFSDGFAIRNHNTTTIAPTGTTSMIADTSGGCEPIYNVAYYKNVDTEIQGDEQLVEFDSYFLDCLKENNIDVEKVKREAAEQMENGDFDGISGLDSVPNSLGDYFVTAGDLTGKQHAAMLCACQKGVDSGISKTCNFPNSASIDDVREVYEYVYDHGGKSVTVYRDGSRSTQVLSTSENHEADTEESEREEGESDCCPDCDGELVFEENCKKCPQCGFSACGVERANPTADD